MGSSGSSLIEVIISATVGVLVVTALTFATIFSIRNANFAKNSAQATKLAQEGIEKVRTLRDRDGQVSYDDESSSAVTFSQLWPIDFSCATGTQNCYFYFNDMNVLTGGSATSFETIPANFKRQFLLEDQGSSQMKVTSIVKWADSSGEHESRLITILRQL